MQVTISIIRYPKTTAAMAIMAMALFRLALWLKKDVSFFKLFGSGKNGGFEMKPDLCQWGMLTVSNDAGLIAVDPSGKIIKKEDLIRHYGKFITGWFHVFKCEIWTVLLEPVEGRGTWDGKNVFGELPAKPVYQGPVAIITRATLRLNKIKEFWKASAPVGATVPGSKGLIAAVGIGEMPWIKMATFSIWDTKTDMESFAYGSAVHRAAMIRAKENKWFAEELFFRFKVTGTAGTLSGVNPLAGKL